MKIYKSYFMLNLVWLPILCSCSHQNTEENTNNIFVNFNKPYISQELKVISRNFIDNFQIKNSIIEVTIDRKSPEELYIILKCRGSAYFKAMKLKPTFTYEMNNNSFFVFTGAEDLFDSTFDEKRFQDRKKGKCNESFKACYWFNNGKMIEDKACTFPYPFSDLKMSEPPLKK